MNDASESIPENASPHRRRVRRSRPWWKWRRFWLGVAAVAAGVAMTYFLIHILENYRPPDGFAP
mgnify:CR=1 FL=1